jgi:hypothetical protein
MNVDMYPSFLFVNMVILAIDKDFALFINEKILITWFQKLKI